MKYIKKHWVGIFIIAVLLLAAGLRVVIYGNFFLSVGNTDTASYIRSAASPLFSWKLFAGERLLTTNLLYKFASDPVKCPLLANSLPAQGDEAERQIQPCFKNITLLQNILAILAWSLLAWTVARWLKNPFLKVSSSILIVAFAFTPQIAEWDYILSPESLTFSLLTISFSIMMEIIFQSANREGFFSSRYMKLLSAAWVIIFIFWIFIRDIHIYVTLITAVLLLGLLTFKKFRKSKLLIILAVILLGIFILGSKSAKDSLRATHYPLEHAFDTYIFPYPSRVEYMKNFGMPERESADFQAWFDANATGKYGMFLITHPRFVLSTLWEDTPYLKSDFEQPYYKTASIPWRDGLIKIGQFLHPETLAVYLIDLLLLLSLAFNSIRVRNSSTFTWTWLAVWFFLSATITLIPTFFGDTVGTRRHIFPSVEMFRLFLWIFLLAHLDLTSPAQPADSL
jgi:hypothetical protein